MFAKFNYDLLCQFWRLGYAIMAAIDIGLQLQRDVFFVVVVVVPTLSLLSAYSISVHIYGY